MIKIFVYGSLRTGNRRDLTKRTFCYQIKNVLISVVSALIFNPKLLGTMIKVFVYGSLRQGGARDLSVRRKIKSPNIPDPVDFYQLKYLGKAVASGVLYDLGPFPTAIFNDGYDDDEKEEIIGEIIEANEKLLGYLDMIEGYNEKYPKHSLFLRKRITAWINNKPVKCWAYEIADKKHVDNAELIESGDWNNAR